MEESTKKLDNIEESIIKEITKIRTQLIYLKQIKHFYDYLHEEKWKNILDGKYLNEKEEDLEKKMIH